MIYWLVGLIFNIVTFPGMVVNGMIQNAVAEGYGAPSARLAVDKDVDLDEIEMTESELSGVARVLGPGETPGDGEREEYVINYRGVDNYSSLFGIVLGPFFLTTILAVILFTIGAFLQAIGILGTEGLQFIVALYPGFAVASHAFPNQRPTSALWSRSMETGSLLKIVGIPIVAVSKLFSLLRFLWVDAIFALLLYFAIANVFGV